MLQNDLKFLFNISEIEITCRNKVPFEERIKFDTSRIAYDILFGTLEASDADISLTCTLSKAGKIGEIPVLDHLIVTRQGYFSFANNDLMPGWEVDSKVQAAPLAMSIS